MNRRGNMTKNVMRKAMENGDNRGSHGQAYKDKSKPMDIRSSNINAAKGKIAIGAFADRIGACSRGSISRGERARNRRKYYLI